MSRQLYQLAGFRTGAALIAVACLGLGAAACSSSSSAPSAGGTGNVTVSIDCAPPAAQNPVQHKEWVEDVAIFEKANPNITIDSVYNYPCEVPATFTASLRAGTEPDVFYSYFTDLPQVLLAGQAADITKYVNSATVPNLNDIVSGSMKAVTAGTTIYGLPTVNYTQGLIYNRSLFSQAGLNPNDPPTTWAQVETDATAIAKLGHGIEATATTAPATTAAGTSRPTWTRSAAQWSTPAPHRPPPASTTPTAWRSCRRCTRCGSPTTR